jgi:hypothetical protein
VRTIDLTTNPLTVDQLLQSARDECVMVKSADGTTFVLSAADDLSTEVELLRRNHKFLALLDSYKQDQRTIPLEEMEDRLR